MYRPAPKSEDNRASMTYKGTEAPKADGRLSMTYSLGPSEGIVHEQVDKLLLKHPKFKTRQDRLDLLTHDLLGITTTLGDKEYALCDISQGGFSYAQEIPANPTMTVPQLMARVDQFANGNHNKILPFNFFFRNLTRTGKVRVEATVRSHQLFFGLEHKEVETELNNFLFHSGIKRKFDPQNFYGKMDRLLESSQRFGKRNNWDMHSIVAMNVTFLNFLAEMGAGEKSVGQIQQKYLSRPMFLKFGLSIDNTEQAEEFFLFALHKNAQAKQNQEEKRQNMAEIKRPYVEELNQRLPAKKVLLSCWSEGLKHFRLPSTLPEPKPKDREDLANLQETLEAHKGRMEELFDLDFRPKGSNACQDFLTENFYWPLIERDKKWFNKTKVADEVRQIMHHTFEAYLRKVGYKV